MKRGTNNDELTERAIWADMLHSAARTPRKRRLDQPDQVRTTSWESRTLVRVVAYATSVSAAALILVICVEPPRVLSMAGSEHLPGRRHHSAAPKRP